MEFKHQSLGCATSNEHPRTKSWLTLVNKLEFSFRTKAIFAKLFHAIKFEEEFYNHVIKIKCYTVFY